jgi:hypothetical protein
VSENSVKLITLSLNLFYFTRKTGSIYNFGYIAGYHRKRLIRIRNNIGAYKSVRKLITFPI